MEARYVYFLDTLERLKNNHPDMTQLTNFYDFLTEEDAARLWEALGKNKTVTEFVATRHGTIVSTKGLSEALKVNKTITVLRISFGLLDVNNVRYLAQALKVNDTLNSVSFIFNDLDAESVRYIAEALKVNSTLRELEISSNKIGERGAQYISEALKVNSALCKLEIPGNELGEDGVRHIAEALKINKTLKSLDIQSNDMGVKGTQYMAEALRVNGSLHELFISNDNSGDHSMKYLFEMLGEPRSSRSLTRLDILGDPLNKRDVKRLSKTLKRNVTLTDLHVNIDDPNDVEYIFDALSVNNTLILMSVSSNFAIRGFRAPRAGRCSRVPGAGHDFHGPGADPMLEKNLAWERSIEGLKFLTECNDVHRQMYSCAEVVVNDEDMRNGLDALFKSVMYGVLGPREIPPEMRYEVAKRYVLEIKQQRVRYEIARLRGEKSTDESDAKYAKKIEERQREKMEREKRELREQEEIMLGAIDALNRRMVMEWGESFDRSDN